MARPVVVVVDAEDSSRQALTRELEGRYGADYRIVSNASPEEALAGPEQLRGEGADVPLVLTDQRMPARAGAQFLARVRELYPTARRALLISWGDQSVPAPIVEAAALGQIDFYLPKPVWSPDEQFHLAITESLAEWWRQQGGQFAAVTVIGAEPSARVHEIRDLLTRNSVPFGFQRADSEEGSAALQRLGLDQASGPVVTLYTGVVLADPANAQVAEALGVSIRPAETTYDVVVVGAGPAGLAAAVYGPSEGLRTALLEREAFGGQAGTSSLIRNYLGFPRGISCAELAGRAYEQPGRSERSSSTATRPPRWLPTVICASSGSRTEARSPAAPLSSRPAFPTDGSQSPDPESLAGAGVFYGAATTKAQALAGKRAFVVGGGNSAGQAALHLSKYAQHVTILIRLTSLAASMSQYLIREIEAAPNIEVRYRTEVARGDGHGRLEQLRLRHRDTGDTETEPADGLFVLIGAQPFTEWLPEAVRRDQWGFIPTGPDLAERWTLQREPYLLETSTPGVFAAGDVRHGSVKRVASAVGDGSIAIRLVHDYLA